MDRRTKVTRQEAKLRGAVIKLAYEKPKLRPHLLPLVRNAARPVDPDKFYDTVTDLLRKKGLAAPDVNRTLLRWESQIEDACTKAFHLRALLPG